MKKFIQVLLTLQILFFNPLNSSADEDLAPIADFTYSSAYGTPFRAGELISFDASPSSDPDGSVVSYEWDFDGNGTIDSTEAAAGFTFSNAGDFLAKLVITDDTGLQSISEKTISILEAVPPPPVTIGLRYRTYASIGTFDLYWSAPDPNKLITEFQIYRDGVKIATTSYNFGFRDNTALSNTHYQYKVIGYSNKTNQVISESNTLDFTTGNMEINTDLTDYTPIIHSVTYLANNRALVKWYLDPSIPIDFFIFNLNGFLRATTYDSYMHDWTVNPGDSFTYSVQAYDSIHITQKQVSNLPISEPLQIRVPLNVKPGDVLYLNPSVPEPTVPPPPNPPSPPNPPENNGALLDDPFDGDLPEDDSVVDEPTGDENNGPIVTLSPIEEQLNNAINQIQNYIGESQTITKFAFKKFMQQFNKAAKRSRTKNSLKTKTNAIDFDINDDGLINKNDKIIYHNAYEELVLIQI